eukprot:scaffold5117_cov44-Attheya_sp.AAC.2
MATGSFLPNKDVAVRPTQVIVPFNSGFVSYGCDTINFARFFVSPSESPLSFDCARLLEGSFAAGCWRGVDIIMGRLEDDDECNGVVELMVPPEPILGGKNGLSRPLSVNWCWKSIRMSGIDGRSL